MTAETPTQPATKRPGPVTAWLVFIGGCTAMLLSMLTLAAVLHG